jgi:hypothetical protein
MKELIDFDAQFVEHMDAWADKLLAKGKKAEEIEELIPEEYEKWATEASKYFDDVEQDELIKMLGAYMDEEITPPDFLIEKIMLCEQNEEKLVQMLREERSTEDKILLMNILSSSEKPVEEYIRIILAAEDEELVEEWKADLGKLYEGLQEIDLKAMFKLPERQFIAQLKKLPEGMKPTVQNMAYAMIQDRTIDSLRIIDAIDEILGTELRTMI